MDGNASFLHSMQGERMSRVKCNRRCSGRASELGLDQSLQLGGAQLRRRLAVTGMHHRPTGRAIQRSQVLP